MTNLKATDEVTIARSRKFKKAGCGVQIWTK